MSIYSELITQNSALTNMGGFPHLMVRLAPLVDEGGFLVVRSTIVKETANLVARVYGYTFASPSFGNFFQFYEESTHDFICW